MTGAQARDADAAALKHWIEQRIAAGDAGRLLGRGYQASVRWFASPWGEVVVKEARADGPLGLLGRRALRHEARVYERLEDVAGTVRCFGLLGARRLVLEHVPSISLREFKAPFADRDRFYARLLATLDALHAAGVAHGDLKRKNNILVGPDEQPYVVDFGIAWRLGPNARAWRRRVFGLVAQMDYNAWMKHKHGKPPYGPELPPEDLARYRPLLLERLARAVRIPWQAVTLRQFRKRRRRARQTRS